VSGKIVFFTEFQEGSTAMKRARNTHIHRQRALVGNSATVVMTDQRAAFWRDPYHRLMLMRWPSLLGLIAAAFMVLNVVFAELYSLQPDGIANQLPPGPLGAFFFSVETLATVGYGDMHPQTLYTHVIATIEIFMGLVSLALITGLMFARFSLPRARVMFAAQPIVRPFEGTPTLMIRAANARLNVISEATARLRLVRKETSVDGVMLRRVYDLVLVREQTPMFMLSWTLMHRIDASSPLAGWSRERLVATGTRLVLTFVGTDDTTSQTLHARHLYDAADICWNHGYRDMIQTDAQGNDLIDYRLIDETYPLDTAARS
jgi:inward rectifier potassium channel